MSPSAKLSPFFASHAWSARRGHSTPTTMSRPTLRSRTVTLYAVCGVAVMLGALGKSMLDDLSEPDINLDSGVGSSTASAPLLPQSPPESQLTTNTPAGSAPLPASVASGTVQITQSCYTEKNGTACNNNGPNRLPHASQRVRAQASHTSSAKRLFSRADQLPKHQHQSTVSRKHSSHPQKLERRAVHRGH